MGSVWSIRLCNDAHTTHICEVSQVLSLLLFSISVHAGFCSTDSCFYSQHKTPHPALHVSLEDRWGAYAAQPSAARREKKWRKRRKRRNLFFHFQRRTVEFINITIQNRGAKDSVMRSYISHIYLYTLLLRFREKEDTSAKHVLVVAWLFFWFFLNFYLSLPFMVSAKQSGPKWGDKSDEPVCSEFNQLNRSDCITERLPTFLFLV